MFSNFFSLESWHNDEHLLNSLKLFVKAFFKTDFDALGLLRLGLTDRITLEWNEIVPVKKDIEN
jgi:hypothetical protein